MKLIVVISFILLQSFNFDDVFGINISEKKCNDYQKMLPPISDIFNDNDEDAALKEFPFMARIENATHTWNGVLISENFVLTVASVKFENLVILGDLEEGEDADDAHAQFLDIIEQFHHPLYNSDLTFDLKLLKLNESVQFNEYIRPACLPQIESTISEQLLEIGWGSTNIRDNYALHKVKLNYITNERCKNEHRFVAHKKEHMKKIDEEIIFCAMTKEGDRDMCTGFGGAALLNYDRNMSTLSEVIGVATRNTGCNDTYPTIFVRLSASLDWIESVVWPDEIVETVQTTNGIEKTTEVLTTKKAGVMTNVLLPTISTPTNEIEKTTHATATNEMKITTDPPQPPTTTTTNKIEITIELSTNELTTKLPSSENNFYKPNNILIIIAITSFSLLLCVTLACFQMKRFRNNEKFDANIQLQS